MDDAVVGRKDSKTIKMPRQHSLYFADAVNQFKMQTWHAQSVSIDADTVKQLKCQDGTVFTYLTQ